MSRPYESDASKRKRRKPIISFGFAYSEQARLTADTEDPAA